MWNKDWCRGKISPFSFTSCLKPGACNEIGTGGLLHSHRARIEAGECLGKTPQEKDGERSSKHLILHKTFDLCFSRQNNLKNEPTMNFRTPRIFSPKYIFLVSDCKRSLAPFHVIVLRKDLNIQMVFPHISTSKSAQNYKISCNTHFNMPVKCTKQKIISQAQNGIA